MVKDAYINEVLDLKRLNLAADLPVEEIRWRHMNDPYGDPALEVFVVLPNGTPDRVDTVEARTAIQFKIIDALRDADVELYPYTRILSRRGYDYVTDPDPDAQHPIDNYGLKV